MESRPALRPEVELTIAARYQRAVALLFTLSHQRPAKQNVRVLTTARISILLTTGVLFLISACNRPQDRIAGKWHAQSGESAMIWEFLPNGTVNAGGTLGRYTFGDQNRLKIQTPAAAFVYQITFTEDGMVWTAPGGARTELKRVP